MKNNMKNSLLILLVVCGAVFCLPRTSSAEETCRTLAAKLANLDVDKSTELINSRVNKPYSKLYAECDRLNAFNGQPLPRLQGRRLKCSTDANRVNFIRKFPDGTIVFRSKMGVDADGSPVSQSPNRSPADQPHTSLVYDTGPNDYVNAEEVSFVVTPLTSTNFRTSFKQDTGVRLGDLAVVVRGERCSFGVIADEGPAFRIGEASIKAHEDLGNPQCKTPGQHPCMKLKSGGNGIGIESGVTFILFPQSRPKPLNAATVSAVTAEKGAAKTVEFLDKFQH
jgi:hypothetical protein